MVFDGSSAEEIRAESTAKLGQVDNAKSQDATSDPDLGNFHASPLGLNDSPVDHTFDLFSPYYNSLGRSVDHHFLHSLQTDVFNSALTRRRRRDKVKTASLRSTIKPRPALPIKGSLGHKMGLGRASCYQLTKQAFQLPIKRSTGLRTGLRRFSRHQLHSQLPLPTINRTSQLPFKQPINLRTGLRQAPCHQLYSQPPLPTTNRAFQLPFKEPMDLKMGLRRASCCQLHRALCHQLHCQPPLPTN